MAIDRYTKLLLTILTAAILLNGLNQWIKPNSALAKENSKTIKLDNNCFSNNTLAVKTLDKVTNLERLLGYLESTVNDVKSTVIGIDRKLGEKGYSRSAEKK